MITLVASFEGTQVAAADIENIENLEVGLQDIIDQIVGTPYEHVELIIDIENYWKN